MISSRGRWIAARTWLRAHSQLAGFVLGLVFAGVGALLWYYGRIGPIRGTLIVGIGASVVAAAIFAYLGPFNESAFRKFISLGIDEVWSSRKAIDEREWVDWVSRAHDKCTLLGIAHGNWCTDKRFPGALRDRLEHGVRVRVLFLNPKSSAAVLRAREETGKRKKDTKEAIRESIGFIWRFRQELGAACKDRLRIYVYDGTPSCGLTWIDNFMIVTHYLAGLPNLTSPALLVRPVQGGMERNLYNVYAENVQNIGTIEVDEKNIHEFLPEARNTEEGMGVVPTVVEPGTGAKGA